MYHVSAQGVDERMINVHYYYYYYYYLLSMRTWCWWPRDMVWPLPPHPHTQPHPHPCTNIQLTFSPCAHGAGGQEGTWFGSQPAQAVWTPRTSSSAGGTPCTGALFILIPVCTHTHTPIPTHIHADNTADHFSMCRKCWWPRREWSPYPQPRLNTRTRTYTNIQLLSSPIQ